MNLDIILVLAILVLAFILFVTERIRMDVVALMVMSALALTGFADALGRSLLTPSRALERRRLPECSCLWRAAPCSADSLL